MKEFSHHITHSEIRYGALAMRHTDGTFDFFSHLPPRFTMVVRGVEIIERTMSKKKVWIGYQEMEKFNPSDIAKISLKNGKVYVE